MCVIDSDNRQPLSIAATAPYRPGREIILTVRTDELILQMTNKTLPCRSYCHCRQLKDNSRLSVAELHGWSAVRAGHQRGGGRRCVCPQHPCYLPCRVGSPVSLAVEQKRSKDYRNKKLNTFFTNRKSESNLKTWNLSAKNKKLADVSYCTQQFRLCSLCWDLRDVERLAYTQIGLLKPFF